MKKLVAVAGLTKLRLFIAEKRHFVEAIPEIAIERDKSHRLKKNESHYHQKLGPDSVYEPRNTPEEIEHAESAIDISKEIAKAVAAHGVKEILLIAEPKMLGHLRKHLEPSLRKLISEERAKDYLHLSEKELAKVIFED